jgi:polyisoprenoid-binding protein YceI
MKAVTQSVSFPFTATAVENGVLFEGTFRINRRDFAVGGNSTISDSVAVTLRVAGRKK